MQGSEFVFISPDMAAKILSASTGCKQRRVAKSRVAFYADEMKNGRWAKNGESISISSEGVLLNGQHRLLACVEAGVGFWSVLVRGVDPSTFDTMDQGAPRKASDVLGMDGYTSTNSLAAALRLVYLCEAGFSVKNTRIKVSNEKILEIARKHPDMQAHTNLSYKLKDLLPPSVTMYCRYVLGKINSEEAQVFFERLQDGDVPIGSQIWALRKRLMDDERRGRKSPSQRYRASLVFMIFRTWNAWVSGTPLAKIQVNDDFEVPMPLDPKTVKRV